MPKPNYQDLWNAGASEKAPKTSIIGGLQKLINEKEDEIISLNSQLDGLKKRMNEYSEIMGQMEQKFVAQTNRIKELEGGSGPSNPYSTPSYSSGASLDEKQTIDRLNRQLRDMENKLYIFSNLPSRITDLEAKIEKQNKTIEDYDDAQEKLKATIRKLSVEGGSDKVIVDLQERIKEQEEMIKKIQSGKATSSDLDLGPSIESNIELQLRQQILTITNDKNQLQSKVAQLNAQLETANRTIQSLQSRASYGAPNANDISARQELESKVSQLNAQLEAAKKTIQSLQSQALLGVKNTASGPAVNPQEGELRAKNNSLTQEIADLKEKLRKEQMKIEEIVAKVQKPAGPSIEAAQGADLAQSLNIKINTLQAQNKKLQEELKQAREGGAGPIGSPRPISGPSLTPSAPRIRAIEPEVSRGKESELNQQISELRKQLAEKDAQNTTLNTDLIESQTKLAQMKAAGPQDTGQSNMMSLMQDLQVKFKKLKDQMRLKDEEIAALKQVK